MTKTIKSTKEKEIQEVKQMERQPLDENQVPEEVLVSLAIFLLVPPFTLLGPTSLQHGGKFLADPAPRSIVSA